jgi:DNA polymerase I
MAKPKVYEKAFFIKMNMQNPPKPKPMNWYVRKECKDSDPKFTVCGYEFTTEQKEDSIGITEGNSPELNFRMAFLPEEGHYWLSRDFSGQELRIMANLSNEETWIKAFLNNEDIHKATAIAIWGEENYTPTKRKAAKAINFGLLYGAGAASIAEQTGVSKDEAQQYINAFFNKLPAIKYFLERCEKMATKYKEAENIYGRKRRLKSYYMERKGKLSWEGIRKAYNFPIQSMGAEITKLALIKLYKHLINNEEYKGKVYFMNTIHDEVNLSVSKDMIEKVAYESATLMEHGMVSGSSKKVMPVPILTSLEIGHNMGLTWKFQQNPDTLELTPEYAPLS